MADNVTDGSGNTFATDDIAGVHYPKEKLVFGADDAFTDVTTSNGLPVNVVANTGLATSAKQDTGNTSLASIDGKITAVNTGAVVISSGTVSTITNVVHVDDNASSLTVDNAALSQTGGGTEAAALRVTIATDSTGVLSVDDNGAALTVDNGGTFVVQENGAALTALQLIDDGVYTDDTSTHATGTSKGYGMMAAATPTDSAVNANDIGMLAMTVDRKLHVSVQDAIANVTTVGTVTTVTTVSSVSAIVAGTGATNLGKAEDGGHTTGDTGVFVLGVRKDTPVSASTSGDADYSQISTDRAGVVWTRQKEIASYSAAYRKADSTNGSLGLSFTFVAEPTTNKQLATIYHTGAASKIVKIRKIDLIIQKGQPGIYDFEVRALSSSTAPATGNPAITPRQDDPADASAEATCLALPTTAGSQVGADTGTVGTPISIDGDTLGPPPGRYTLYEYQSDKQMKPLIMRAATAEGYAIVARCTVAAQLIFTALIDFTEE